MAAGFHFMPKDIVEPTMLTTSPVHHVTEKVDNVPGRDAIRVFIETEPIVALIRKV